MPVTVILDHAAIERITQSPTGMTARYLIRRGAVIQSRARRNLGGGTGSGPKRVDTGLLRATLYSQLVTVNGGLRVRVGSRLYYALYVHEGTGIHGPKKTRIYPKTAKVMVWKSVAYGHPKGKFAGKVTARSTKGMVGNKFLVKALPDSSLHTESF